ncbi:MAG: hypothetical protein KGQ66_00420 [Acidobacteriota bacterium]|nr:hypothetical protein [Acidobacteriota bacterium]
MRWRMKMAVVVAVLAWGLGWAGPVAATVQPAVMPGDRAVGLASTASGRGYWVATAAGDVLPFGDATGHGSLNGVGLTAPVVGVAATPDGGGYWLVAADGGVFAFGDARFFGSAARVALSAPVVGVAATPDGGGYWLAASDGGVFAFGDARFSGSLVGAPGLDSPVRGISALADDSHYWLVTAKGALTVFGFSSGSWPSGWADLSSTPPVAPFVEVVDHGTATDVGVWLLGGDGGVFTIGSAPFFGSAADVALVAPVVAMAPTPDHQGYWLLGADGGVFAFGDAPFLGSATPG